MKVNFEMIYEHIGYLFYALASERGKLSSVDYIRLKAIIDEHWETSANGEASLQSYLNEYLLSGLRSAYDLGMDAGQAYCFFENYYTLSKLSLGKTLFDKILLTVKSIASAFSRNGRQKNIEKSVLELLELKDFAS